MTVQTTTPPTVRALHGTLDVRPTRDGGVMFTAQSGGYFNTKAVVDFPITPEDCITLSRALVKAAAEALGVKG